MGKCVKTGTERSSLEVVDEALEKLWEVKGEHAFRSWLYLLLRQRMVWWQSISTIVNMLLTCMGVSEYVFCLQRFEVYHVAQSRKKKIKLG